MYARVKPLATEDRGDVTVIKRFEQQKSIQVRNLEFPLDWIFDEDAPHGQRYSNRALERANEREQRRASPRVIAAYDPAARAQP